MQSIEWSQINHASGSLDNLRFVPIINENLPIDKIQYNETPRTVKGAIYSRSKPTPVKNPKLVSVSTSALRLMDLGEKDINNRFIECFSGNRTLNGSDPMAHCYCGHQFGQFAGQLGDGRAHTLGIIQNGNSELWELQLKGSGKTPYSRRADGRAVLRSSIREFLCSEALHHLGVPTTRAASVITSESKAVRDPMYDGRTIEEPCTIILRLAPTFIRFGSFEIAKCSSNTGTKGPSCGLNYLLPNLMDYLLKYYYTDVGQTKNRIEAYEKLFGEIVVRTARLVAQWQTLGFCHGVLNTDNMSILGLTIDFGPFAFMEKYDPKFVSNHSDTEGLYSFMNQPKVCYWNLTRLAEALKAVLPSLEVNIGLDKFWSAYHAEYNVIMHRKLGLTVSNLKDDTDLFQNLFETMYHTGADFTNVFRTLSMVNPFKNENDSLYEILGWCDSNGSTSSNDINNSLRELLNKSDNKKMVIDSPDKEKKCTKWKKWLDQYRCRLQYDISLMNSKEKIVQWAEERKTMMNISNPKFILRNWMAQEAIAMAEKGDYREVNKLLKLLQDPYGIYSNDPNNLRYTKPEFRRKVQLSCSS